MEQTKFSFEEKNKAIVDFIEKNIPLPFKKIISQDYVKIFQYDTLIFTHIANLKKLKQYMNISSINKFFVEYFRQPLSLKNCKELQNDLVFDWITLNTGFCKELLSRTIVNIMFDNVLRLEKNNYIFKEKYKPGLEVIYSKNGKELFFLDKHLNENCQKLITVVIYLLKYNMIVHPTVQTMFLRRLYDKFENVFHFFDAYHASQAMFLSTSLISTSIPSDNDFKNKLLTFLRDKGEAWLAEHKICQLIQLLTKFNSTKGKNPIEIMTEMQNSYDSFYFLLGRLSRKNLVKLDKILVGLSNAKKKNDVRVQRNEIRTQIKVVSDPNWKMLLLNLLENGKELNKSIPFDELYSKFDKNKIDLCYDNLKKIETEIAELIVDQENDLEISPSLERTNNLKKLIAKREKLDDMCFMFELLQKYNNITQNESIILQRFIKKYYFDVYIPNYHNETIAQIFQNLSIYRQIIKKILSDQPKPNDPESDILSSNNIFEEKDELWLEPHLSQQGLNEIVELNILESKYAYLFDGILKSQDELSPDRSKSQDYDKMKNIENILEENGLDIFIFTKEWCKQAYCDYKQTCNNIKKCTDVINIEKNQDKDQAIKNKEKENNELEKLSLSCANKRFLHAQNCFDKHIDNEHTTQINDMYSIANNCNALTKSKTYVFKNK
jgi:hypothetical protein